jgi:hypothetical protein
VQRWRTGLAFAVPRPGHMLALLVLAAAVGGALFTGPRKPLI